LGIALFEYMLQEPANRIGFISVFLLISGGLGMAYNYAFGKNINLNRNSFYTYNESKRQYGKWILFIRISILLIEIYILFINPY